MGLIDVIQGRSGHAPRRATRAAILALLLAPAAAAADSFEAQAEQAIRVRHIEDVVWALTARCDRGDDVQNRQCRQLRDRAEAAFAGATLLVDGEPGALRVGAWSAAKKSVPLALAGCIRCAGVEVDGQRWYVATSGAARVERGEIRGATLFDGARAFPDEATAAAWSRAAAGARVQLVVRVPHRRVWPLARLSGASGVGLDVAAYRVFTPCDGAIIAASPASGPVEPAGRGSEACAGAPSERAPAAPAETLPDSLSTAVVRAAMKPVVDAANECFVRIGVAGRARLELAISAEGKVESYRQAGDFANTPTGACIDEAMAKVQFPRSKRATTKIAYPIVLQ